MTQARADKGRKAKQENGSEREDGGAEWVVCGAAGKIHGNEYADSRHSRQCD